MRDFIKNQKYWDKFTLKLMRDILQMDEMIASKTIPVQNIEQTVKFVEYERLCLSISMYSSGMDIQLCKEQFVKSLNNLSERNWKLESYVDVVWYISLSVLFNLGKDASNKLQFIVPDSLLSDKIVALLMSHLGNVDIEGKIFAMSEPYSHLSDALEPEHISPVEVIRTYLSKYWYKEHNKEPWYNSHKSGDLYFGYWSFESGAIAKVLGIVDSDLKNEHYYPYELVHY